MTAPMTFTVSTLKKAVALNAISGVELRAQGKGFHVLVTTRAAGDGCLVTEKDPGKVRSFAKPETGLRLLRSIGIARVMLDTTHWDSAQQSLI